MLSGEPVIHNTHSRAGHWGEMAHGTCASRDCRWPAHVTLALVFAFLNDDSDPQSEIDAEIESTRVPAKMIDSAVRAPF